MSTFGQYSFGKFGSGITVSADGSPVAKVAGVQIGWAGVKAVAAAYTFKDQDSVEAGEKFIRYGTLVARVTAASAGTLALDANIVGKFVPFVGTGAAGQYTAYNGDATMAVSTAEGDVFIINRSVHEDDVLSDHPEAIDGGRIYKRRLLVTDYGDGVVTYNDYATDLADIAALGLTLPSANAFKTALPQVYFVVEGNTAPAAS